MAAAALVALLTLALGAATARAEPLSMTFTEARANVGVQLSDEALFARPAKAPFAGQIDPVTGSITAGVLDVPDFETFITEPIDAFVTVEFHIGVIGGSFDRETGALELSGTAGGTLTSEGRQCAVSTTPAVLTLTTAGTSGFWNSRSGRPFASGLARAGAIAGQWTDMHATALSPENAGFCANVDARIGGLGGVWLEQRAPGRVAAGSGYSCAIKADDVPTCWGNVGALPSGIGTVTQISAGGDHACAVRTDATPVCWGDDEWGQASVPAGIGTVTQIAAGTYHTCAVKTDRTPVCWGDDEWGQSTVPGEIGAVTEIAVGVYHSCAVEIDGTPVCWGDDSVGQSTPPAEIGAVSRIAAGGEGHTCAIEIDGTPVCWGADDNGQATVPAGIGTVSQIAAGGYHTCAVKMDGTPVCWGREASIGPQPTLPPGIGAVSEIAAGEFHSCALKADDTVVCWGGHIYGQLGGSPSIDSAPPRSPIGGGPFSHAYTAELPLDGIGAHYLPVRFFVSNGELPPGLSLDATTGVLSGSPTQEGTFTGAVSATNDVFAPDAQAFSITVDTTPPVAPTVSGSTPASPSSDLKPRIVGAAEAGSTVRLYDDETCTGSPLASGSSGAFASPGLQVTVAAGSTTTVYATATDAAGNKSACSTSTVTYAHKAASTTDPGTPGTPSDPGKGGGQLTPTPKPRSCVVPKLAGRTLKGAKKALKAAGCKLGKVTKPKRRKGKRQPALVVKRATPRRGARPADRTVDLELRVKPKRARR